MRITVEIDEDLLQQAERITGIYDRAVLVNEAFRALIVRERARGLASLGEKDARARARRRRPRGVVK